MAVINQIAGDDGANTLQGGNGADLIYGFDPNGTTATVASISTQRVASGLSQPIFATAAPGDFQHLFVVERTGAIKVLDLATGSTSVFLDLSSQITTEGEGGLLGLAFDPDYAQNRQFYVSLTNPADDTEIRRYEVPAGSPLQADPASKLQIIAVDQPAGRTNHKAGWLGFGPDGHLYVPLGDGGGGGDPDGNGQNPQTLLGKVIRLDVHGDDSPGDPARNYIVPSDNPFVGVENVLPEIWALGLRNPFRASFDRSLGVFYIADVGQNAFEEIDIGQSGANYGWDRFEGPATFQPGNASGPGTLTDPIHFYDHTVGHSITGGYVYRGESDGLQGQYFFADFVDNRIFTLQQQGNAWIAVERTGQIVPDVGTVNNPTSFAEDAKGNLYLVDIGGSIFRLTPNVESSDAGDTISGLAGDDVVHGGTGNDSISGGDGNDVLYGGSGNDFLRGDAGGVLLAAGSGLDHLIGGAGADFLDGGAGIDFANYSEAMGPVLANLVDPGGNVGEAAGDRYASVEGLIGSTFGDALRIGNGGGSIWALAGNDTLFGGAGNDDLHGMDGNDHLLGGAGADDLDGGSGIDFANYSIAFGPVLANLIDSSGNVGEAMGDQFGAIEGLIGSTFGDALRIGNGGGSIWALAGDDTLFGGAGSDDLHGQDGDDHLLGGAAADVLDGGAGTDFANYSTAMGPVLANLLDPSGNVGEAAGDTYDSIEGLIGSSFGDTLRIGNGGASISALAGDDYLFGGAGGDDLHGGNGADVLFGSGGADLLEGGTGNDVFVFGRGSAHGDTVLDFAGNGDAAGDSLIFSGYGTAGQGATFTQVDATHWSINSSDGLVQDVVTFANSASIHISDLLFV